MSNLWKRSLSMLLAVVMIVGMVPMSAFATEEQDASTPAAEVVVDEAVANVQGMINALPETVDSEVAVDAVWMAIEAIDAAAAELTEEQAAQLDYSRYNAAMDAAAAFVNPEFDEAVVYAPSLDVLDGNTTPTALITAVGYSHSTGRVFTISGPSGSFKTNESGTLVDYAGNAAITVTTGTYTISYRRLANTYSSTLNVKVYHNVTASVDPSANAEGAGSFTATGKVYHDQPAVVTVTDVDGYKAELYNGGTLVTTLSDEAGWTYNIEKATESVAYTVKYVSTLATEYPASVEVVYGEWGAASLGTDKGIAGAEIGLTVTPAKDTNDAKYSYTVAVENGTYADGKVTVAGTGEVKVTVTFTKASIAFGADKKTEVEYNGFYASAVALPTTPAEGEELSELDKLKKAIFETLDIETTDANVDWDDVTIQYWPYYNPLAGDSGFCDQDDEIRALGAEAPGNSWGTQFYNFGERAFNEKATIKTGIQEMVRISYNGLYVETEITLVEGRVAATVAAGSFTPAASYNTAEALGNDLAKTLIVKDGADNTMDNSNVTIRYEAAGDNKYTYYAKVANEGASWLPSEEVNVGTYELVVSTYKLVYDVQGGSFNGTAVLNNTVAYGTEYTLATPTWLGHTFQGWKYTDAAGNETTYAAGATFVMPGNDVTLEAQWTANQYTITVAEVGSVGGVTIDETTYTATSGEDWTMSFELADAVHYVGVSVDSEYFFHPDYSLDVEIQDHMLTITISGGAINSDLGVELTAEGYVYVDLNGGEWSDTEFAKNLEVVDGKYAIPSDKYGVERDAADFLGIGELLKKDDHKFQGLAMNGELLAAGDKVPVNGTVLTVQWAEIADVNYSVKHYLQNVENDKYTLDAEVSYAGRAGTTIVYDDVVRAYAGFTAQAWTETYTIGEDGKTVVEIYYNRNVHNVNWVVEGVTTPVEYKYGAKIEKIADPAKTGHTFTGWTGYVETMPDADVTITANFQVNKYTVGWMDTSDGRLDTLLTTEVAYGEEILLPTTIPTKEGYTFKGWANYEEGMTMPAYDLTSFNAIWEINKYTVKWVVDGVETSEIYEYGKMPVAPTNTDKATANYVKYTFAGWDKDIATVTDDVTYTAQYNAELLANNGAFTMNGYYEARGTMDEIIKTLKADVLNAAGLPGANASNYTVTMKYSLGNLNLDKLTGWENTLNATAFFTAIELPESGRQFTITDNATGVSKTVTMKITDSRGNLPETNFVVSEQKEVSYITDANVLADMKAKVGDLELKDLKVTAGALPENTGDETSITYAATFAGNATYQGTTVTIKYEKVYKPYNDCSIIEGGKNTDKGSVKVNGTAADDAAVTVAGNTYVIVEVTPSGDNVVESITITKNGETLTGVTAITYNNKKASVAFTTDGATIADEYVVSATYSENYLNLKADQTIVYCVDDTAHTYDLQKLVFEAIFGDSNAPMTKDNVTLEYNYWTIPLIGTRLWGDISKNPTINYEGITHKFGESGSETIRLKYSDAKYGSFEQEIVLNVFDSCYDVEVDVQILPDNDGSTIKTQFSKDPREYMGTKYFKTGDELTVTLTPAGEILDMVTQLYNGTYGDNMPYIKSVTVYERGGAVVPAEVVRGQGKLDLGNILQGVNPMLYNAAVTFTLEDEKDYFVVVEYDELKLEKAATETVTLDMYQAGKNYPAEVPTTEELIDAILGEEYADNFIATYGGAFTVEYTNALLQNQWTAVSDEALLALADGSTINVRITWKPLDGDKTYYPVAVTGSVKLEDPRNETDITGIIPTEPVEFVDESKLVENLKNAMGFKVLVGEEELVGASYEVAYTTVTGDAENGFFTTVTVTYDGSKDNKPKTVTFENVPVADIPDNATVTVTAENAEVVITNNAGVAQTAENGVYTVLGNSIYTFTVTPATGYAIESISVNGTEVALTYKDQVVTYTLTLTEKEAYAVEVVTVPAAFDIADERVYDFATGLDKAKNEDIVDAAVEGPTDIDYADVAIEYLARAEGKVTVSLPDIDLGFTTIELGTFDIDLGQLWLNPEEPVEAMEEADLAQLLDGLVDDVIDKVSHGELAVTNALTYIQDYIKKLPLGIHAFGANGDGSTETIRISYKDGKYLIAETETNVTIHDYRTATEIAANDCEVTFGYSLEQLIAAAGAQVMADGAAVSGLKIESKNLGLHVKNGEQQQVTLTFAGDATYQPCKTTINVIVNKATCEIDYDSQIVTFGDDYDFSLNVTPAKMPDGTTPEIDRIEMFVGVEMDKLLDVDFEEDKTVGLGSAVSFIQLRLPQSIRELPLVGDYLKGEFSLGEFTEMINGLSDLLGIDENSMGILNQVVESITGFTDNMDIKVRIVEEEFKPAHIGVYIAGAVTVDADFETAYTADYLIVKPNATEATLAWDYNDANGVLAMPAFQETFKDLMGAHVIENDVLTGDKLAAANENIKYLVLGINDDTSEFLTTDIYGNIKANIWATKDMTELTLDNGAYIQVAYMLNWSDEIYYAMPIIRSFLVVPEIIDVTLVGDNGTPNRELLKTYTGEQLGFSVKVTNEAGELIYSDHYQSVTNKLDVNAEVTYNYIGVQTNGKTYQSNEKPVQAGVYAVTISVVDKNAKGDILAVGADMGLLIIEPSKSTISVDDDTIVYDGNEHALADLITVDSVNSDKTPDTTIITAAVADTGDFSEEGWEAIEGYVNVDFPKWVDELMAEHVPGVTDGITVGELKDKLMAKLPDISDKLLELGATEEIINSLANLTENVSKALANLPEDIKLTFQDNATAKDIGVFVVMGVVTDSDHYPAADYGILVITPDAIEVELKYDQDSNNIFTPEALKYADLNAKAYDPATGKEITDATARITNVYVGLDIHGNTVVTDDPTTLDNGIYTQFSYIWEADATLYYAEPISRVIVLVANPAEVIFVDETGAENNDRHFVFDNTAKAMDAQISINGEVIVPAEGELVITYTGVQNNGKTYYDTKAPVHAGVYMVTANYNAYNENGKLMSYGAAVGSMIIEPTASNIVVTGDTVTYDGNGYTATVENTLGHPNADYILISGGAYISGDADDVGVDAFHGNVNIDFPRWMDEALAEYEFFQNGVDAAYLARFITSYRDELLAIPMDRLANIVNQEELEAIAEKLNSYMDELVEILGKMPADVALTFQDNITYTMPGAYFYYGIVADSDHYTSTDTGLLVIEKAPMTFGLLDTTRPYTGYEQYVIEVNPENTDYFAVIADRDDNTVNLLLDNDMLYLKDLLAAKLGVEIPDTMDIAALRQKVNVAEIVAAIEEIIAEVETLALPDYAVQILNTVKTELQSLPNVGTIYINGALPVDVGDYEIYAVAYSDIYETEVAAAVLTIAPIHVVVDDVANSKVYGENDPTLTAEVTYYSYFGITEATGVPAQEVEITAAPDDIELVYNVTRVAGENVGTYAMQVENASIINSKNYILEVVEDDTLFTITPAALEITVNDATKVYGDADPAFTYEVTKGALVGEDQLNVTFTRVAGEDVGTYAITATVAEDPNYTFTVIDGELEIKKADLEITVNNQTKVYGDADPALTYVVSGLKNGDAENLLNISIRRKAGEDVGTYAITAAAANDNYNIYIYSGELEITPAALTITLNDQTKVYGENDPTWTWTVDGLKLEDTEAALNIAASRASGEAVGEYAITATAANANYTITVVDGKLTITPAALTITLNDQTKVYGENNPTWTWTVDGLKLEDTEAALNIVASRTAGEDIGEYTITATAANANYTITVVDGKLTITPASIDSVEVTGTYTYDSTEQTATVIVKDVYGNTLVEGKDYTVSGNKATNAGTYTVTVEGMGNYTGIKTAEWTIAKAEIVVVADDKTMGLDEQIPELTFKVVEGDVSVDELNSALAVTLTTNPEMNAAGQYVAGEYEIAITAVDGDNWIVKEAKAGKLTVTIPDDYICWNVQDGIYYNDVTDGLKATESGEILQMLKDATAATNQKDEVVVIVSAGVTFDLNGYYVETDNMLSYGVVLDTATGTDSVIADGNIATGGIVISNDTRVAFTLLQPENGGYFPIYDGMTGSYKFFAGTAEGTLQAYDTKGSDATRARFRFRLMFANMEAYQVIARTMAAGIDTGFDVVHNMSWTGITGFGITYTMSDDTVMTHVNNQFNGNRGYVMTLIAYGIEKISGGYIDCEPTLVSQTGVVFTAETLHYDVP